MLSRRALTVSRRWLSTASYETLHVERHDHGVVHVQLNRPDKRNASRSLTVNNACSLPRARSAPAPLLYLSRCLPRGQFSNLTYTTARPHCVSAPLHCQIPPASLLCAHWSSLHTPIPAPAKVNLTMWKEFRAAMDGMNADESARCVVVSGAGSYFTAGMDLSVFAAMQHGHAGISCGGRKYHMARDYILQFQDTFTAIERCRVPVIAAVEGGCIGAGVDMVTACDLCFSTADAEFSVKEVRCYSEEDARHEEDVARRGSISWSLRSGGAFLSLPIRLPLDLILPLLVRFSLPLLYHSFAMPFFTTPFAASPRPLPPFLGFLFLSPSPASHHLVLIRLTWVSSPTLGHCSGCRGWWANASHASGASRADMSRRRRPRRQVSSTKRSRRGVLSWNTLSIRPPPSAGKAQWWLRG